MQRKFMLAMAIVLLAACSSGDENANIESWIIAPANGDVLSGEVQVQIGFEGPAESVEILVNGEVASTASVGDADGVLEVALDTTSVEDGAAELSARAFAEDTEGLSEAIDVLIDNVAPIAAIDLEPMEILDGEATISITVDEANIDTIRLLSSHDGELVALTESADSIEWDTTTVESRVHALSLEVVDIAGNTTATDEIPIIVGNNGRLLDQPELEYSPSAWVMIPDPFDPEAEIHTRVIAEQDVAGEDPENIVRVVTWMTWETEDDWAFEYAFGQGICPHRGVAYAYEESDSGLAYIDMAWTEVPASQQEAAMANDGDHPDDAVTFPFNGDPATCGSFFGHVAALEPESHAGEEISFTANFFFIYGAE